MADNFDLLSCVQLTKYYQHSNCLIKVLRNINLNVRYNEIIAVVGTSGSGKSTLLHLLGGLDKPTRGEVFLKGNLLNKLPDHVCAKLRNQYLGFVYQFHHLLPDFNVLENVAMPLLISGASFYYSKNKARDLLNLIGLSNRAYYYPHELSGGESQKVAIARAVINNPELVLADEPTGNLDQKNSDNIFQLLKMLNVSYGITFLIATHDLNLAKKCHKILSISYGRLVVSEIVVKSTLFDKYRIIGK